MDEATGPNVPIFDGFSFGARTVCKFQSILAGPKWSSCSIFLARWQACLLAIGRIGRGQLHLG